VKRPSLLFLLIAAGGLWILAQRYEIRGIEDLQVVRNDSVPTDVGALPAAKHTETIRVASFNLGSFGPEKSSNAAVMEILARIIREFDVVAVQELCSTRPEVLRNLMDLVNETGSHYAILMGPHVDPSSEAEQFAYIFDRATIQTDRGAAYVIDDPDGLLSRPPLVGWFRVRGLPEEEAFTFTLVNVDTCSDQTHFETRQLEAIFYKVRDDGRNEDDLIMLGDFHLDDQKLGTLKEIPGILAAISGTPTDTQQTAQYDNLLFQLPATVEYTGRSGVFDFLREYNLTLEQALQISDHLPVWAEFNGREGGGNPAIATMRGVTQKR